MIKRFLIAVVLLAAVGGGLVWFNFFRDRMIADFFANMPVQTLTVSTVTASPAEWQPSIAAIGTANAIRGVNLSVEVAGIVREIEFSSNDEVEEGAVLLRLDDAVQLADLEAARTLLDQERTSLERTRELQARGVATSVSLEAAQASYQAAEAQMARASAIVEQRKIIAPFSGTIGIPRVDPGGYVTPGSTVATLQQLDTMRVDFNLPEQQLPLLSVGQKLIVRAEGVSRSFEGEITGIDPRVDAASRLVALRGSIANPNGEITPGQFVRISVSLPAEEGVIALPQTAVISSLYGDYVYLVRPNPDQDNRLEARQVFVQTGRRAGERVEIREGVSEGDIVVTVGQNRLNNGAVVALEDAAESPVETAPDANGEAAQPEGQAQSSEAAR